MMSRMTTDDATAGGSLTRREIVALVGLAGAGLLAGRTAASPLCVVRPQQTEGPYFIDEKLDRSDIRSDPTSGEVRPGVALQLVFNVSALRGGGCAPLGGASVDVWHCDALGAYSDGTRKFLRGYQATDGAGVARFTTIYPGWYPGRAVHVHFKVRTDPAVVRGQEFTSQIYFDEAVTDQVYALQPYARGGRGRPRNDSDGLFRDGGRQLLVAPTRTGQGYAATFDLALTPS
jgi:protocatechuate 3,4-dioxygenase beta subunit